MPYGFKHVRRSTRACLQWRSHLKNLGAKMFDFRRATVFLFGRRFSKHKMTRYAKNFGGYVPPGPPVYAYACLINVFDCYKKRLLKYVDRKNWTNLLIVFLSRILCKDKAYFGISWNQNIYPLATLYVTLQMIRHAKHRSKLHHMLHKSMFIFCLSEQDPTHKPVLFDFAINV